MKDALRTLAAVTGAFILFSILSRISYSLALTLNLLSVVVLYFAVRKGEIYGAVTGMFCGLLQDSFSLGVFGVMGIAKTISGYTAGYVAKKIDVVLFSRRYAFFAVVLALELVVWGFLYGAVFSQTPHFGNGLLLLQPFLSALVAAGIFPLVDRIDRLVEKRKNK